MKTINRDVDVEAFFKSLSSSPSLLILDYDGTLSPFAKEREQAYPYQGVKERLAALRKLGKTRVVIVSGRSLSGLERVLNLEQGIELWGSHGLERKLPNGKQTTQTIDPKTFNGLKQGEVLCMENVPLEYCEKKPFGVAFHWRGMDAGEQQHLVKIIENGWKTLCNLYDLEIHSFDGGIELRPKGHHKGEAIKELLQEMPKGIPVAYLGDDATDEEAFAALGDQGLKVLVRKEWRPTLADIQLLPPNELLTFFDNWIAYA